MKNSDLHNHSYYSDGQLSPKELVNLAKKRGIKNLALTDHNSLKGIPEAIKQGKKIGINIIPGVEIRCQEGEILGYFLNIKHKELNQRLKKNSLKRQNRVKEWCKKLSKAGYNISFKEIWENAKKARGNINEFYVLYLLYKKGYGKSTMEVARKILSDPKLKPKDIKDMKMISAIRLIRKAGGVPVLAHPWIDDPEDKFKRMKKFVEAGLKGIEVNNGDRAPLRSTKIVKKIKSAAKKYNLILTSGSDYHGEELVKQMPGNHNLGFNCCDEKVVEQLRKLSKKFCKTL